MPEFLPLLPQVRLTVGGVTSSSESLQNPGTFHCPPLHLSPSQMFSPHRWLDAPSPRTHPRSISELKSSLSPHPQEPCTWMPHLHLTPRDRSALCPPTIQPQGLCASPLPTFCTSLLKCLLLREACPDFPNCTPSFPSPTFHRGEQVRHHRTH